MFRIPSNLDVGFVAFGLSFALMPLALADSAPGSVRTDVKIEAKDFKGTATPAATPNPLTLRSLSATHAADVHLYVAKPDTKATHTLRIQSK